MSKDIEPWQKEQARDLNPGETLESVKRFYDIDPDKQEIAVSLSLIQIGESQGDNGQDVTEAGRMRLRDVVLRVLDRPDSRNMPAYLRSIEWISYLHVVFPKDKDVKRVYKEYKAEGELYYQSFLLRW